MMRFASLAAGCFSRRGPYLATPCVAWWVRWTSSIPPVGPSSSDETNSALEGFAGAAKVASTGWGPHVESSSKSQVQQAAATSADLIQTFMSLSLEGSWIAAQLNTVDGRKVVEEAKIPPAYSYLQGAPVDKKIAFLTLLLSPMNPLFEARSTIATNFESVAGFLVKKHAESKLPVPLAAHFSQLPNADSPHGWELLRNGRVVRNGIAPTSLPEQCVVLASCGTKMSIEKRCLVGKLPYCADRELLQFVQTEMRKKNGLIIVSGESGSGKTWGMMGIAKECYKSSLIFYFDVECLAGLSGLAYELDEKLETLRQGEDFDEKVYERWREERDSAVSKALQSSIIASLECCPLWPHAIAPDDEGVITVIIDEIGGVPTVIRALCRTHRRWVTPTEEKISNFFRLHLDSTKVTFMSPHLTDEWCRVLSHPNWTVARRVDDLDDEAKSANKWKDFPCFDEMHISAGPVPDVCPSTPEESLRSSPLTVLKTISPPLCRRQ